MAAFERAIADKTDGIEFDIRFTADRQWVVHHDAAIPVGGEPLRIADLSVADIAKLNVGPSNASVPTLTEFLGWAKTKKVPLIFDIKDRTGMAELIATVEAADLDVAPVFSSFHKSVVRELRTQRPKWQSVLIVGNPRWRFMRQLLTGAVLRWATKHQLYGLSLHERWVTPSLVHKAQNAGINIAVWTVDEPVRMSMLALLGVDAIITNRPDLGREMIDSMVVTETTPARVDSPLRGEGQPKG